MPQPEISAADAIQVHRFVARRVANREDAADIAQQSLLRASEKISSCRGTNVRNWLLTIARNLVVEHYRTRSHLPVRQESAAALFEARRLQVATTPAVHEDCERRDLLRCAFDCIARHLRPEEQIAVLLADAYDYRDRESATALGMSVTNFKWLLHGARRRLRDLSGGRCQFLAQHGSTGCRSGQAGCAGAGHPSRHAHGQDCAVLDRQQEPGRAIRPGGLLRGLAEPELLALLNRLLQGLTTL